MAIATYGFNRRKCKMRRRNVLVTDNVRRNVRLSFLSRKYSIPSNSSQIINFATISTPSQLRLMALQIVDALAEG
ncbi:galactoside-binding soluble lectin 13 [Corchorus olitorius]|uniref:Galactoside-binding soluble lectin 13 n=1 Tax=Corchorus olitorius TaxID=93759 RepID=A0A1R3KHJ3_9ROSI|nr:galactoside-binding soluble lectin 13 [Corchorus olitorius]